MGGCSECSQPFHIVHTKITGTEVERARRERAVVAHRSSPIRANSLRGLLLRVLIVLQQLFVDLFPRAEAHRLSRLSHTVARSTKLREDISNFHSSPECTTGTQPKASPTFVIEKARRFQSIARLSNCFGG